MIHEKKIKVVMLATDNSTDIARDIMTGNLIYLKDKSRCLLGFHLYFLSDEEIKEGDWSIVTDLRYFNHNVPFKVQDEKGNPNFNVIRCKDDSAKKIIATTNTELNSLKHDLPKDLIPRPSNSFIQKFVEEYNKGNVIEEVMVEYDSFMENTLPYNGINDNIEVWSPKVAIDNTITIKPVVETWSDIISKTGLSKSDYNHIAIVKYLKENYNPPTKKVK